jgi:hypothetical protein
MIEYARLHPGRGFRASQAARYYMQRIVTPVSLRRIISGAIARTISVRHPAPTIMPKAQRVTERLREDGYSSVGTIYARREIAEMAAYVMTRPVRLRDGRIVSRAAVPPEATIADLSLDDVLACPNALALANSQKNIAIAAAYLGCAPTISTIGIRWSFPGGGNSVDTQRFHRDPDDWKFVKFFIYLSDVDSLSGPHQYILGTHLEQGELRARTWTRDEMVAKYGADRISSVTGPIGTAFFADTHGVHAGPVPQKNARLMMEVGYSLLPIYALKYQPRTITEDHFDAYINRLIFTNGS